MNLNFTKEQEVWGRYIHIPFIFENAEITLSAFCLSINEQEPREFFHRLVEAVDFFYKTHFDNLMELKNLDFNGFYKHQLYTGPTSLLGMAIVYIKLKYFEEALKPEWEHLGYTNYVLK